MKPPPQQDPLKTIHELWPRLRPWQRKSLLARVYFLSLPSRLSALRPRRMVLPATLAQAAVFLLAVLHPDRSLYIFALGNFIVIALAMLPSLARSHVSIS